MQKNMRLTFIDSDMTMVKNCLLDILKDYKVDVMYGSNKIDVSYVEYNQRRHKLQIWKPLCGHGVVMWGNIVDGFLSIAFILNKKYGLELMRVSFTLDTPEPGYEMRFFRYMSKNGTCRYVHVMQDPRWEFWESGEPLPFEQTERYKERIKKKRLTNGMLLDYLLALGWDLRSPDFWKSDGDTCYFEWDAW